MYAYARAPFTLTHSLGDVSEQLYTTPQCQQWGSQADTAHWPTILLYYIIIITI